MFNKKLCPKCKTGRITYVQDPNSPVCPYMMTYWNEKCPFYEKDKEIGIFEKIKIFIKHLRGRKFNL